MSLWNWQCTFGLSLCGSHHDCVTSYHPCVLVIITDKELFLFLFFLVKELFGNSDVNSSSSTSTQELSFHNTSLPSLNLSWIVPWNMPRSLTCRSEYMWHHVAEAAKRPTAEIWIMVSEYSSTFSL